MKTEILCSENKKTLLSLDPRTKIVLLIMVAIFVLGGAGGYNLIWARITLAVIPALLILLSGKRKAFCIFVGLFFLGCFLQYFLLGKLTGFLGFLVLASAGTLSQFIPGYMMGYYVVTTTSVSEFIAAMELMHVPKYITIPISVMFRFFPTVAEEMASISDAMSMRGISFGGKHPSRMLEYRLVPLLTCTVKIGEELSAAALTRGLGAPNKRTNICEIGFRLFDILLLVLCGVILIYWILVTLGGVL